MESVCVLHMSRTAPMHRPRSPSHIQHTLWLRRFTERLSQFQRVVDSRWVSHGRSFAHGRLQGSYPKIGPRGPAAYRRQFCWPNHPVFTPLPHFGEVPMRREDSSSRNRHRVKYQLVYLSIRRLKTNPILHSGVVQVARPQNQFPYSRLFSKNYAQVNNP